MPRKQQSPEFVAVRDAILALQGDRDRARLAGLLGCMTEPSRALGGSLRATLRAVAALPDDDLERLVNWFHTWVNAWGSYRGLRGTRSPRPTGSASCKKKRPPALTEGRDCGSFGGARRRWRRRGTHSGRLCGRAPLATIRGPGTRRSRVGRISWRRDGVELVRGRVAWAVLSAIS